MARINNTNYFRLDIQMSGSYCDVRAYTSTGEFCFLIRTDVEQSCCENFEMTINGMNYNSCIGNSIVVLGEVNWDVTTERESDAYDTTYICSISFGDNEVIRISNTHEGYYPHSVTILDIDDCELFSTLL